MDAIPDRGVAHSSEPDQHGRLCWQPGEPDQPRYQRYCRHQGYGRNSVASRPDCKELKLQRTSPLH